MMKYKKVNDFFGKLLGIPLLGAVIPNVSGLINNSNYNFHDQVINYLWFTLTSFSIWIGNVGIHKIIRERTAGRTPVQRTIIMFLLNIIYSSLVAFTILKLWVVLFSKEHAVNDNLLIAVLLSTNVAILVGSIYEILYLNVERESDQLTMMKLDKAKIESELSALKNQIDPHFIFNSLNTLSILIQSNPVNARQFNDNLAKVYRYILSNKDKNLVSLKDEIEFISNYFYLLKLRFEESVDMRVEFSDLNTEAFLVPPISLQTLVENAIKHNTFTNASPLHIDIQVDEDYVVIRNNIHKKDFPLITSKIGLKNLNSRYQLLTSKSIYIELANNQFTVKLPIVKALLC